MSDLLKKSLMCSRQVVTSTRSNLNRFYVDIRRYALSVEGRSRKEVVFSDEARKN